MRPIGDYLGAYLKGISLSALAGGMLLAGAANANPGDAITGGGGDDESPMDEAMEAIDDHDYRDAVRHLREHLDDNGNDADALNLMGYSLRKLERYDKSEQYYLRALEIEPEHLGANEYLGELYLDTGRPELARERLAVLEEACPDDCEARRDLSMAIEDYAAQDGP